MIDKADRLVREEGQDGCTLIKIIRLCCQECRELLVCNCTKLLLLIKINKMFDECSVILLA